MRRAGALVTNRAESFASAVIFSEPGVWTEMRTFFSTLSIFAEFSSKGMIFSVSPGIPVILTEFLPLTSPAVSMVTVQSIGFPVRLRTLTPNAVSETGSQATSSFFCEESEILAFSRSCSNSAAESMLSIYFGLWLTENSLEGILVPMKS